MIGYHLTSRHNLNNIKRVGIFPKSPRDMDDTKGVYLFKNKDDLENALLNWLGERIDSWESTHGKSYDECCIEVNISNLKIISGADYEIICLEPISPDRIISVTSI